MFLGIKSVIYPSHDLENDKRFWQQVTGIKPYFDQPFYVGFTINDQELGLDPNADKEGITYPIAYWHVANTAEATTQILASGATINTESNDVGGGLIMTTFKDFSGNIFGIIEHPKVDK